MSQQITPTMMNLQLYKQKTKAAQRGYDLLKKKNDSLKKKMQDIMIKLIERKKLLKEAFTKAFLSIAESEWAAGDFFGQVRDTVGKASFTLDIYTDNIAGVQLPIFIAKDNQAGGEKISRLKGSAQIEKSRGKFKEALELITEIASLQTSFIKIDKVIRITSRRVNALEYIVIPKFTGTVDYIRQELDEQAREGKFTLKKVLDNRRKAIEEMEKWQKSLAKGEIQADAQEPGEAAQEDDNEGIPEDDEDEGLLF
jgi:V-type H+-transporting ATPase subunit D